MKKHKIGLIIPHPEDQKWDTVFKFFRFPNLTLPTLAALIPEDEWDIEIQDEDAEKLTTLGDMVAYIERCQAERAA